MHPPENYYLIGMPGSGKTTLGNLAAEQLGFNCIDLDQYISGKYGQSVTELFTHGERHFRQAEQLCLQEVATDPQQSTMPTIVSCGGGVVETPANRRLLQQSPTIFLNCPLPLLVNRLLAGTQRPLLAGLEQAQKEVKLKRLYTTRLPLYWQLASQYLNITEDAPETNVINLIKLIKQMSAEVTNPSRSNDEH